MKNEHGSTLLLVMLTSLIFIVLGLAIISASIGGSTRTEIRELEVNTTEQSKDVLEDILIQIKQNIASENFIPNMMELELPPPNYDDNLKDQFNDIIDNAQRNNSNIIDIVLEDITSNTFSNLSHQEIEKTFTRVYTITIETQGSETNKPEITRRLIQKIILTPTPSFLQYSLGSSSTLQLNGSLDIIGNVYAEQINIDEKAKFTVNDVNGETDKTYGTSIYGTLFTNNMTKKDVNNFYKGIYKTNNGKEINGRPIIKPTGTFIDMNFDETYKSKLKAAIELENLSNHNNRVDLLNKIVDTCSGNTDFKTILMLGEFDANDIGIHTERPERVNFPTDEEFIEALNQWLKPYNDLEQMTSPAINCGEFFIVETDFYRYKADWNGDMLSKNIYLIDIESSNNSITGLNANSTFILKHDISIGDNWIVADGNLTIDATNQNDIIGNLLVEGDLLIAGNDDIKIKDTVSFDTTAYVKKESKINNVTISGVNDKQLVLISNGDLNITRINEFHDVNSETKLNKRINNTTNLKGFFYTEKSATLYGVGSKFDVNGGVFAKGNLTVNAIRGNITKPNLLFNYDEKEAPSRFYVQHDSSVIIDQLDALPRVNQLHLIVDELIIK
ncbi:hypothetical protein [Bacillus solimangrovi]|uniref:Uncharacterized protein n=1 Tax=Bacillus solimangrovi TaxID=1305675 RepID=A0A1E5LBI3_9BACI|nr:hypothetical protein [Bacillus solimangrovi]OEH91446.1 hypothetical protein BFG57_04850 [Bacillus solimangrovi]